MAREIHGGLGQVLTARRMDVSLALAIAISKLESVKITTPACPLAATAAAVAVVRATFNGSVDTFMATALSATGPVWGLTCQPTMGVPRASMDASRGCMTRASTLTRIRSSGLNAMASAPALPRRSTAGVENLGAPLQDLGRFLDARGDGKNAPAAQIVTDDCD